MDRAKLINRLRMLIPDLKQAEAVVAAVEEALDENMLEKLALANDQS